MQYINRQEKGQLIAQCNGSVKRINEKEYVSPMVVRTGFI
jgi:hypothetical protein